MVSSELSSCMEQTATSEADSHSFGHEMSRHLWNARALGRVHKSPLSQSLTILSQVSAVHILPPYFPAIN